MGEERAASAGDGARLHYALQGEGRRRYALTHSLAMTGAFWRPVIEALGPDASILTWDCRGHGRSDKPAGPYSVEQFADDLATVLDDAGWDRAIVAGASMGGCVSLAFAVDHADRVTALGLFDTTASYGASAPQDWETRAMKAKRDGLDALTDFQQTRWFSDAFRAAHPDIVDACVATFRANDVDAYVETCRMLGRADLTDRVGAIAVPTAIVVGEEDYATPPAMAAALDRAIPNSTMEVISGARHLTPLECPELIADRLRALA